MNTTRRIRYQIPRYMFVLLFLFCALLFVSTAQTRSFSDQADEAIALAEEAVDTAEYYQAMSQEIIDEANSLVAEYYEMNQELQAENASLYEALSAYCSNYSVGAPTPPRYFDVALPEELQSYIWSLCNIYGIAEHYELMYALIQYESNFDAAAVSSSHDWGLMQINEVNHAWLREELGIVDFLDPYDNVHCGIHMLAPLLNKYDVSDALMAYNMGETGAAKLWRRSIHSTTYTEQVLDYYKQFTGDI